ncbi:hypothetical protein G7Z17_g3032 [Cylindrodendrum hubeiense]|uniref:Uncharacterized protein n=1 Tax=Cylindrodendrum hubeiense TaxID=595255 RepID=A0A9P5HBN8_9HYPO|nr:hypothetical protein G7Z17_g3032 [Cylindrodendrum hubeiense]
MGGSINPLRRLTSLTIEYDQVPDEIRCCLELVRTCNQDLQRLIELRNEHLALLEKQPDALERVNNIIGAAHKGLAEICEVVEKCRPEANRGKTPFRNRMKWIFGDSTQFRNQEPVISRHHATVLAELNFVRQVALWAPIADQQRVSESQTAEAPLPVFNNIGLLGDLMGDVSVLESDSIPAPRNSPPIATPSPPTSLNMSQTTLSSWPSSSIRQDPQISPSKTPIQVLNPILNGTTSTFPSLPYDDEKEVVKENKLEPPEEGIVVSIPSHDQRADFSIFSAPRTTNTPKTILRWVFSGFIAIHAIRASTTNIELPQICLRYRKHRI